MVAGALPGRNRKGNALLCRLWGETDIPVVAIVKSERDLRKFIAEQWVGSRDDPDLDVIVAEIAEHNFSADDASVFCFEFEIGGAEFEDVAA